MRIALDYDNTYTADPPLWDLFITQPAQRGHQVVCVTMRHPHEPAPIANCDILYTGRKAKRAWASSLGMEFDIWIDDSPEYILRDAFTG